MEWVPQRGGSERLIQAFEEFFPLGGYFRYEFLHASEPSYVLHCEILKTPDIRKASDGKVYLRRGAQSIPQNTDDKLARLRFNKGIISYEDHLTNVPINYVTNSEAIIKFILETAPDAEPEIFLRKQQLLDIRDRPWLLYCSTLTSLRLFCRKPV
jgi:ATP-dependent DNA helicase RecG